MADINSTNLSTEAPDFSMLALFMQADLVVKSVIIILILASLYSWNVIISKILRIRQLKKLEKEFEDIFWSGNCLLYTSPSPRDCKTSRMPSSA